MDNGLAELTRRLPCPRLPLTREDGLLLTTAFLISGRWAELNLSEAEAAELLLKHLECRTPHGLERNRSMLLRIQNRLMAIRMDDFFRIQLEPPFSNEALRHLNRLDDAWKARGADGFYLEWKNTFTPDVLKKHQGPSVLAITGGPGHSEHDAFCIEAIDPIAKINAEYWYLNYVYGLNFELGNQFLIGPKDSGRRFDVLEIVMTNGVQRRLFFDVTSSFVDGEDQSDFARYQ
jgi:hypothetical protein